MKIIIYLNDLAIFDFNSNRREDETLQSRENDLLCFKQQNLEEENMGVLLILRLHQWLGTLTGKVIKTIKIGLNQQQLNCQMCIQQENQNQRSTDVFKGVIKTRELSFITQKT
ncbi:unnamed protein product [Paramecium octaurelia]|uniref:Uncharacterized protein n=1 Tax=Paramecium octaurelia TaxID=43137 RepID=A0A8S1TDY7_PAROT|nr:unnamed protein product [Paramecium octaurelia]